VTGTYQGTANLQKALEMGVTAGVKQTLDRLAAYMEELVATNSVMLLQYPDSCIFKRFPRSGYSFFICDYNVNGRERADKKSLRSI